MPDWELRQLADQNKLRDPNIFHAQTDRLLEHPHAQRFVKSFTDQWLNLNDIDFTSPDTRLYCSLIPLFRSHLLAETRGFF